jgi:hypothetical protein
MTKPSPFGAGGNPSLGFLEVNGQADVVGEERITGSLIDGERR